MHGKLVGYEFLKDSLGTCAFPQERPARVASVTKVTTLADAMAVPAQVAPASNAPLEHLLFALKHEGLQLQAAILSLKRIDSRSVGQAFVKNPSSAYMRQICFLWELANGETLEGLPAATGPYTPLFDPDKFVTGPSKRHPRWRVDFNGLGSSSYCLTVRRTPEIQGLLDKGILESASQFIASLDKTVLDRAVRWAYLSETQGSYAIENEAPSNSKAEAFSALLARAHAPERITEGYLVALQNLAVSNPLDKAVQFRTEQNWLRNALPGAIGVTYLPPEPALMIDLMDQVMALANSTHSGIDPLVLGALVSFGFVLAHPFMDGNGRLSRFLFHKVVCGHGQLPNGLVLPVSVAMKRHEERYLQALQTFSKPVRELWQVTAIDDVRIDAVFKGDPDIYRFWDATDCVAFGLQMASEALDHDLREESAFLQRFDHVYRAVNDAVDMNNNDLVLLVRSCLQNAGKLSMNRQKQLIAKGHPPALLEQAQWVVSESLKDLNS